ncbi:hypothetical protein FHG66_14550 [Rubellimicrobium rubrum]|uniref:Uncharacterized protein n=1 Tax=Rubellimicrobium rubrum TaxID=2585369 RepID=A0A5C4MTT8_9RHOB|nr:hypothetical protein [Rubellimicrobium rubrum]TNC48336.1 hypothetical protein FHG66_14550 [Rubellimicrobium rubrum]
MPPRLPLVLPLVAAVLAGMPALAQEGGAPAKDGGPEAVDFGTDSSEWAMDGECDDRRFAGDGMATSLSWINVGRDATDCRALVGSGGLRLWNWAEALAATQCDAIDFGDDTGEFADDGECDDIRFEGPASASGVSTASVGKDAGDCSRLCAFGVIARRDH